MIQYIVYCRSSNYQV